MTEPAATPPPIPHRTKTVLNVFAASIFLLFSLYLVAVDFKFSGDALFQTSGVTMWFALFAFMVFVPMLVLAIFPKRFVIGISFLVTLRLAYGYPLNSIISNSLACRAVSLLVLLVSVLYFIHVIRGLASTRPWVRLKHSLWAIAGFVVLSVVTLPLVFGGAMTGLQNLVGDYAEVSLTGVTLKERVFEKEGQKVHLVGMMHIGDKSYYDELDKRMGERVADGGRRLILTEGVGDREKILPEGFKNGGTYGKFAEKFGLDLQGDFGTDTETDAPKRSAEEVAMMWATRGVVFENADMDVSDLEPEHREALVDILTLVESGDMLAMLSSSALQMDGLEIQSLLMDGLLGTRNEALMAKFDELAAGYSEVYMPWGAAHLGEIEDEFLERGYVEISEVERPIVRFFGS